MKIVHEKADKKLAEINRINPFMKILGTGYKIEKLVAGNAISGNSFRITREDGKRFKLRYFDSRYEGWQMSRNIRKFPNIFPKFYGRQGKFLLFDWIEGTELNKLKKEGHMDDGHYEQLGRIYGEVHQFNDTAGKWKARKFFRRIIDDLLRLGIINDAEAKKLRRLYSQKSNKIKHDVVLEAHDLEIQNYMVEKNTGNVLMVDDEGLRYRVKGLGMYKAFIKRFSDEERAAFLRGYNSVHSDDYFNEEYQQLLAVIHYARDVRTKAVTDRPYDKPLKRLREFLAEQD